MTALHRLDFFENLQVCVETIIDVLRTKPEPDKKWTSLLDNIGRGLGSLSVVLFLKVL